MNTKVSHTLSHGNGPKIVLACPECRHKGVFEIIGTDIYDQVNKTWLGQRRCPNDNCFTHIFYILNNSTNKLYSYPQTTIEFNREGIPEKILAAFEEAVKCHSIGCHIASAIMIRKTLEEISNKEGTTGKNLKEKLKGLGNKITIPKELMDGMDDLRLLGNDAAHVEANTFEQIGNQEIEISIEFTKEILKATYQYEGLLNKLRSLRKNAE